MPKRLRGREREETSSALPRAEALGHLEDCWDEPVHPPCPPDIERLQGAWVCIGGRRPAEFLVSGSHVTVHFKDGAIYLGSFELNPASRPRTMDVRVDEGPPHHKGLTASCIYELDGDTLRWCTAGPGQSQRPGNFSTAEDPNYLCLVFRREQPARASKG